MLAHENRLSGKRNFELVRKEGKIFQSESFGIAFVARDIGPTRFGFIISNKISKLSTERNRIKRAMREAIKKNIAKVKQGFDVVLLGKQSLTKRQNTEIVDEVETALAKSGLIQ